MSTEQLQEIYARREHQDLHDVYAGALTALLTVPSRLRYHRERLGLSLRPAAEQIGIGFNTLYRVENGEQYTEQVLIKLLVWLIQSEKLP